MWLIWQPGDYGRVEIAEGERHGMACGQLQIAARQRGLALRFHPGPGNADRAVIAGPHDDWPGRAAQDTKPRQPPRHIFSAICSV